MSGTDGSGRRSRSIIRSRTVVRVRCAFFCTGPGSRRSSGEVALIAGLLFGCLLSAGCRTDQAAQDGINQMRAEQIAIEDRYAALRNEYEKLRNRLAVQGDVAAEKPGHPSALPLNYPPGASPLDGVPSNDPAWDWSNKDFPALQSQPAEAPVPLLRPNGSVLEGDSGSSPAKPSRVDLDPGQTQVTRSPDGQQVTLRMVARTSDAAGRAANPTGTYSIRLLDASAGGNSRVIGDWNFPAESIRRFIAANGGGQGRAAQVGVPLEVSFVAAGSQATQWLAELEYFPSQGKKLTCREWVGDAATAAAGLPSWGGPLPQPRDGRGLMSTGNGSVSDGPAWSPQRQ